MISHNTEVRFDGRIPERQGSGGRRGVGSGFGKATAKMFAAANQVNLVLIDRNEAALKATASNCEASKYGLSPWPAT